MYQSRAELDAMERDRMLALRLRREKTKEKNAEHSKKVKELGANYRKPAVAAPQAHDGDHAFDSDALAGAKALSADLDERANLPDPSLPVSAESSQEETVNRGKHDPNMLNVVGDFKKKEVDPEGYAGKIIESFDERTMAEKTNPLDFHLDKNRPSSNRQKLNTIAQAHIGRESNLRYLIPGIAGLFGALTGDLPVALGAQAGARSLEKQYTAEEAHKRKLELAGGKAGKDPLKTFYNTRTHRNKTMRVSEFEKHPDKKNLILDLGRAGFEIEKPTIDRRNGINFWNKHGQLTKPYIEQTKALVERHFGDHSNFKEKKTIWDQWLRVKSGLPVDVDKETGERTIAWDRVTGVEQIASMYTFIKSIDPNSAVKADEIRMFLGSESLANRVATIFNNIQGKPTDDTWAGAVKKALDNSDLSDEDRKIVTADVFSADLNKALMASLYRNSEYARSQLGSKFEELGKGLKGLGLYKRDPNNPMQISEDGMSVLNGDDLEAAFGVIGLSGKVRKGRDVGKLRSSTRFKKGKEKSVPLTAARLKQVNAHIKTLKGNDNSFNVRGDMTLKQRTRFYDLKAKLPKDQADDLMEFIRRGAL